MAHFRATPGRLLQSSFHWGRKLGGMARSPLQTRHAPFCFFIHVDTDGCPSRVRLWGPLIVGLVADSTGSIPYTFFFLVLMVWLAIPVLWSVDVERGRIDAKTYAVERVES